MRDGTASGEPEGMRRRQDVTNPRSCSCTFFAVSPCRRGPELTLEHWSRILEGDLFAASSRVGWAVLLRRTFGFDALRWPKCDARMRPLATVPSPLAVQKLLSNLGVPTEPLPRARARDPTGQESFGFDAA